MATGQRVGSLADRRRRKITGDDGHSDDDNASISSGESDLSEHTDHSVFDKERLDDSDLSETASTEIKQQTAQDRIDVTAVTEQDLVPVPKHLSTDSAVIIPCSDIAAVAETVTINDDVTTTDQLEQRRTERDHDQKQRTNGTDPSIPRRESVTEQRRREHEEYRRRRDVDPTFVPNRGKFFMHDARAANPASSSSSSRPTRQRPESSVKDPSRRRSAFDSKWTHDLHEAVNVPLSSNSNHAATPESALPVQSRPDSGAGTCRPNPSTSRPLATGQLRVCIPGDCRQERKIPATLHSYTRLPDLRSPLRRDNAVRVALPFASPAFVLPLEERSFVFIPRAFRSKQHSQRGPVTGHGRLSRQNSTYGDSWHSSSLDASRRSSVAPHSSHDASGGRYVVKLPRGDSRTDETRDTKAQAGTQHEMLPGDSVETAIVHQPFPQKGFHADNVDFERPSSVQIPYTSIVQPFENQIPREYLSENRSTSSAALSEMPPSTDPYTFMPTFTHGMGQPPPFPSTEQMAPPGYYELPYAPAHFTQPPMPVFGPHVGYAQDGYATMMGSGMMAHESNGMTYYIDQGQMPVPTMGYPPAMQFGMPSVKGGPEMTGVTDPTLFYPSTEKGMIDNH